MSRSFAGWLLGTPGADPGCEETFRVLDAYVEALLRGEDLEARYPAVVTHLRNCTDCREDADGLLATIRAITPPPQDHA